MYKPEENDAGWMSAVGSEREEQAAYTAQGD